MKLIPLIILAISLAVDVNAQKFRQEQFPFPPQFQTPSPGLFSSDSSLYLPPESHTTIPYFPIKSMNNLQFPYLPATGTKAPAIYPSPFPLIMSSSMVPNFDDDDDDEDDGRIRISTALPPLPMKSNYTDRGPNVSIKEKREMRGIPNMAYQQPIDRIDIKFPPNFVPPLGLTTPAVPVNQTPASRKMIISTETHRNDFGLDQIKAASFQGNQYIPAPGVFISSTTEPAIPILRLSNEMDLDGSFSYEALGADQTHYVQHSHMENMGTDKEEQVVEGSYSYVGDNGQTYTVHYIADSNGFRASGDHLPVAPPIPEIIQRSIQYNLAEEAKKPPHLKTWQDEQRDNDISNNDKSHNFAIPPPRNLFTGRTPEAFSYSYSQGTNTQNNLIAAASSQVPVKTVDISTEPSKVKPNNGPISPQVTFLASQGAHLPSMNTIQNSISRMFTTEKPSLPQIVNYEAAIKESEQDNNKALWRWQYGMNANNLNQNSNKGTISRSFGEGDDIMINFSDMSPEQYTKMIRSQIEANSDNVGVNQYGQNQPMNENFNAHLDNYYRSLHSNNMLNQNQNSIIDSVKSTQSTQSTDNTTPKDSYNTYNVNFDSQYQLTSKPDESRDIISNSKSQVITQQNLNGLSQVATQKYTKIHPINENFNNKYEDYHQTVKPNDNMENQNSNIRNNYSIMNENEQPTQPPETVTPEDLYNVFNANHNSQFQTTVKPVESRDIKSETRPKIITHKNFVFPNQIVTQSYDFDEFFYEPRKIKALNSFDTIKTKTNNDNDLSTYNQNVTPKDIWSDTEKDNVKVLSTEEPSMSSISSIKFTDFIVQESKDDFKPIVKTSPAYVQELETTTAEPTVEEIFQNNIFLKNLFRAEKVEPKTNNKVSEESKTVLHNKIEAEPKTDKMPKFIQYHSKPMNEVKTFKKKPLDIADVLNYVSMKNHFESSKVKSKSKPLNTNHHDHNNDVRFIPIQQERNEESNINTPEQRLNNFRTLKHEQQEELRGIIKNYKVLQRNNHMNTKHDNNQLKRELSPPPLIPQIPSLPPLGRAGPSMKSYLPPIYV